MAAARARRHSTVETKRSCAATRGDISSPFSKIMSGTASAEPDTMHTPSGIAPVLAF
jgi:hypothetical protein